MASDENNLMSSRWKHFKGNKYCVLFSAKHTDNKSNQIVYAKLKDDNPLSRWLLQKLLLIINDLIEGDIWVRGKEEFNESIEKDGLKISRFRRLS